MIFQNGVAKNCYFGVPLNEYTICRSFFPQTKASEVVLYQGFIDNLSTVEI